jgi:hypothetical protein
LSGSEVVAPNKFNETCGSDGCFFRAEDRRADERAAGQACAGRSRLRSTTGGPAISRSGGARLHGSHAAIDVLLPLIAVSFGLTAIGVVFVIVRALSG